MTPGRTIAAFVAFFVTAATIACSVTQARIGIDAPPEDQFAFPMTGDAGGVGDYLVQRCGTLDCHGQIGRNLRIWGVKGMRLLPDGQSSPILSLLAGGPSAGGQGATTTPDEYEATYRSLVGLEPAVMSQVVQSGAANPELLTFVRKAIGIESHKGGHLITPGDDQWTCIVSWLAANTDKLACQKAIDNYPSVPAVATPMADGGL